MSSSTSKTMYFKNFFDYDPQKYTVGPPYPQGPHPQTNIDQKKKKVPKRKTCCAPATIYNLEMI